MSVLYQRLPQRIFLSFGIRGASAAFALLLSYILIHLGSIERLGSFSVGLLTSQLVAAFCLFGMDSMLLRLLVREASRDKKRLVSSIKREAYGLTAMAGLCGTILTAAFGGLVVLFRPDLGPAATSLIYISPAVFFSCLCQIASAVLRSEGRDAQSQIVYMTIPSFTATILLVAGWISGRNWTGYVEYLYILGALLSFLLARRWAPHSIRRSLESGLHLILARRLRFLRLSAPIQFSNITNYLADWVAVVSLSLSAPLSAVAVLRVISQLSAFFQLISSSFEGPLASAISLCHLTNDRARLNRLFRGGQRSMLLMASPVIFTIFIFPDTYLSLFKASGATPEFALRLILIAQFIRLWTGASSSALNVLNGTRELIKASLAALLVSLFSVIILTPAFELVGAAIAGGLTIVTRSLLNYYFFRKVVSRPYRMTP